MYGENDFIQKLLTSAWPDWKLASRLGKGSYGSVYEIYRDDLGTRYTSALKVLYMESEEPENDDFSDTAFPLSPDSSGSRGSFGSSFLHYASDSMIEDFIVSVSAEIKTMIDLKGHPNIVSIEDYAVRRDKGFCAILIRMEKLEVLTSYIKRTGNISRSEVIRLGSNICDALSLCEKKNIIHRDIKLSNIFFSEKTGYKLGDFGISRTMASIYEKASMSGSGTPQYMAPEVYRGDKYNNTADLYSLGMVLYILTNDFVPPLCNGYSGTKDHMAIVHQANMRRMNGEALPAPSLADAQLSAVILRACSPRPEERYPTADAFREALRRCLTTAAPHSTIDAVPNKNSRIIRNFPENVTGPVSRDPGTNSGFSNTPDSRSVPGYDNRSQRQERQNPSGYAAGSGANEKPDFSGYAAPPYTNKGSDSPGYAAPPYTNEKPDFSGYAAPPYTSKGSDSPGYSAAPYRNNSSENNDRFPLLPAVLVICLAIAVIFLVVIARVLGGKDSGSTADTPQTTVSSDDTAGSTGDTPQTDTDITAGSTGDTPQTGSGSDVTAGSTQDTPQTGSDSEVTAGSTQDTPQTGSGSDVTAGSTQDTTQTDTGSDATAGSTQESPQEEPDSPSLDDPIEWSDDNLKNAVYKYLNFEGTMTYKDASSVRELDLTDCNITDISSLQYFTRIGTLDLADNSVDDLTPLAGLQSLRTLHLENNLVTDISPLADLTGLKKLDLCTNFVSDISAVENMTSLIMFDARENKISDISALKNMVLMQDLYLGTNQISDISCLAGMTSLTYLNISFNKIKDISVVGNMTDLRVLTMTSNKISDISCLRNCKKIYHLKMKDNLVTDFSVLDELPELSHIEHD